MRWLPLLSLCVTLVNAAPATVETAQAQSLREVLATASVPIAEVDTRELDRRITSFAAHDSTDLFVIAYYNTADGQSLEDSVRVMVYAKPTRTWQRRALPRVQETPNSPVRWQLGSIIGVQRTPRYIYLRTHLNPSAGFMLALAPDLSPVASAGGWPLVVGEDDFVLYHANQVHFAPTHAAEVRALDVRRNRDVLVYPRVPHDSLRLAFIERVRVAYARIGEAWFRVNNHHMDAERFDTSLDQQVRLSADGSAAAFVVRFGDAGARAPTPEVDVVVVCRDIRSAAPRCHEQELARVMLRLPGRTRDQLLTELANAPPAS
jgi:hypothetical protein